MTLQLDRTEVESDAGVLGFIPQPDVEETITWVNRIFIAADPNKKFEKRTNVTPIPSITVNYQYLLPCSKYDMISMVRDHPSPEFYIPLYHQMMICESYEFGRSTFKFVVTPFMDDPFYFPFYQMLAIVGRSGGVVYKDVTEDQIAARNADNKWELTLNVTPAQEVVLKTDKEFYIAPVAKSYIDSRIQFDNPGENRSGATLRAVFRLDSEWERELNYEADIDFTRYAQTPIVDQQNRNQISWTANTEISKSLAYAPYGKPRNTGVISVTEYFLPTATYRRDYYFRGNLIKNLGAFTADKYIFKDDPDESYVAPVYRLDDDIAVLSYLPGRAQARLRLLEVDP